ncbi:hypothetical protein QJQ45_006204 [Haematococcus lacustris]|nr:hypothetical protein QJQ45_006204 [Haematococcus lacustris]
MEPGGPLPPHPPELTARYIKKLLTLEEISQAHASSVYSQKYSIEVVGGKIKAVCNDCKMALSCGNLSDARKHQCNKRPRSDQHAIAGGTSSDMLFERITACWNPDQRMPANIMAEFWRRIHMWFIDAEIPFAKVDNPWLRDALTLAGIGMMSERSLLLRSLLLRSLLLRDQEVQGKVAKQEAELEQISDAPKPPDAAPKPPDQRAKMLIYIKANAGLGARRSNEVQLLAFYDRDVSAALNIRGCAVGPGPRPTVQMGRPPSHAKARPARLGVGVPARQGSVA